MGFSAGHIPFIWDIHDQEVIYDLDSPIGKRDTTSLWEFYEFCLDNVSLIVDQKKKTLPALCSMCKLCHWRSFCKTQLKEVNDLSLIPELGRSRRDAMLPHSETELFFDVETDPMRDIFYLHGFVERRNSDPHTEKNVAFFANQPKPEDECRAFKEAWIYIQKRQPYLIYYYSPYERTVWRKLQKRYPEVMTEIDLENINQNFKIPFYVKPFNLDGCSYLL